MEQSDIEKKSSANNPIVVIFLIQILMLIVLGILFGIGLTTSLQIGNFWFAIIMGPLGASVVLMNKIKNGTVKIDSESKGYIVLTLMPLLYGTIMAGITYLIFMSQILSGDGGGGLITTNIFPNFTDFSDTLDTVKAVEISKLIDLIGGSDTISRMELMDTISSLQSSEEKVLNPSESSIMQKFLHIRPTTMADSGKLLVWCFISGYSENFITGILRNMESNAVREGRVQNL